ncbi:MAG: hypothetical protein AAGF20_10815, partial [Pseudomonadota bacterium]
MSRDRLRVKGYKGSKFFSKTMIWTKAPADLERCDGQTTEVIAAKAEPKSETVETVANTPVTETA